MLGKRDHSTVLHGVRKIEKDLEANSSLQGTINVLIKKIDPSN
jgi:chromosomal replication initiator protein